MNKIGHNKSFKRKQKSFRYLEIFFHRKLSFGGWVGGGFLYLQMHFSQNNFHHELLPHGRFQLSHFCIYGYSGAQNHMYIDREHCASRSRSQSVICSHFARTVIEICSNFAREMIASIFDREHLCEQPLNFKQFRRM